MLSTNHKKLCLPFKEEVDLDLPTDLQLELFDSLIMPTLLYGCEIWGFENITMIEKINLKYLKYILGLKQTTPTCIVLGETGKYPLKISIKCRMISYWSKLLCQKESKLSNIMYKVIYQYNSHGVYTSPWLSEIKNILDNTGHSFIANTSREYFHSPRCKNRFRINMYRNGIHY